MAEIGNVTSLTRAQFLRGDWRGRPVSPSASAVATVRAHCLAHRGIMCHACGDACEAGAIRFAPAVGQPPMPSIDADVCTGCGECVGVCPADAAELRRRDRPEA